MITDAHPSVRGGGLLVRGVARGMRSIMRLTRSARLSIGGMVCSEPMRAKSTKSLNVKRILNKEKGRFLK